MYFIPPGLVMEYTIYPIGYGNQIATDFFERLEIAGESCLVLDVRARRKSWCWSYTGTAMEMVCKKRGHDYLWMYELGAAGRRNGGEVRLVNEPVGMMALECQVRKAEVPVVLMCAELRSADCHRLEVARRFGERLAQAGDRLEIRFL